MQKHTITFEVFSIVPLSNGFGCSRLLFRPSMLLHASSSRQWVHADAAVVRRYADVEGREAVAAAVSADELPERSRCV